jgi:hypothetical protein
MTAGLVTRAQEKANGAGPGSCSTSTRSVDASAILADCCRTVFGRKTGAQVSALLGLSERAAKSRLACEREYTADEIRDLLQSEQGIHFLVALMGEARPAWWVSLLRMGMLGGIARRRAADLRLLKRVADADRSSPIKAAQMVQDEDFFGPVLEAFDAVTRAQSRAVDADS